MSLRLVRRFLVALLGLSLLLPGTGAPAGICHEMGSPAPPAAERTARPPCHGDAAVTVDTPAKDSGDAATGCCDEDCPSLQQCASAQPAPAGHGEPLIISSAQSFALQPRTVAPAPPTSALLRPPIPLHD